MDEEAYSAETYWEFSSDNPTAIVASIKPLLDSFTARHREAVVHRQDSDSSIDHIALCLRAEINPGRAIRIYAKTNRRIRVEVIHQFGGAGRYTMDGCHTANSWPRLPHMVEGLAENAAALVNRMFAPFRSRSDITSSHFTSYRLGLTPEKWTWEN